MCLTSSLIAILITSDTSLLCSGYTSANSSPAACWISLSLASRACFSGRVKAALIRSTTQVRTFSAKEISTWYKGISRFGLPTWRTISCWKATSSLMAFWPKARALSIVSSSTWFAPASTIIIASCLPATVRCNRLASSCSTVGLRIGLPSTCPTITLAIGPSKGISEIDSANEAPNMAAISGELS